MVFAERREREREWWVFLLSQDWFKGAYSVKFWKAGRYVWFYYYFVLGSLFWNFHLHSFLGFWSILLFSLNFFVVSSTLFIRMSVWILVGFQNCFLFSEVWVIFSWKFTSGFRNSRMDIELVLWLLCATSWLFKSLRKLLGFEFLLLQHEGWVIVVVMVVIFYEIHTSDLDVKSICHWENVIGVLESFFLWIWFIFIIWY